MSVSLLVLILSLIYLLTPSFTQTLNSPESNSVTKLIKALSPSTSLSSDPCLLPHGVVCEYFENDTVVHVTELKFGFVSDYSPNPECYENATLDTSFFEHFKYLRKMFFYKCFNAKNVSLPNIASLVSLEELVFIENKALVGSLKGNIKNLRNLRRLVITGTSLSGEIPEEIGDLVSLQEVSLSRNNLSGRLPSELSKLKNLKLLDLGYNKFTGDLPGSIGGLSEVLKVDLSYNQFSGRIPECLKNLKKIELLDLGYNKFGNYGVPLFLSEMKSLKEVYLSGNLLEGSIPEIWENLGGIVGVGLSNTGLVGNIPKSMGVFLKNVCYIGLDNNGLVGPVPDEFESMGSVLELNLENNLLTGRVPFSARFVAKIGEKLKLQGNPGLCVDGGNGMKGSLGKLNVCTESRYFSSSVVSVSGSIVIQGSKILLFFELLIMLF